jgi:hypothetical protein
MKTIELTAAGHFVGFAIQFSPTLPAGSNSKKWYYNDRGEFIQKHVKSLFEADKSRLRMCVQMFSCYIEFIFHGLLERNSSGISARAILSSRIWPATLRLTGRCLCSRARFYRVRIGNSCRALQSWVTFIKLRRPSDRLAASRLATGWRPTGTS